MSDQKQQDGSTDRFERSAFSIFDLKPSSDRLSGARRFPEITAEALRLVWRAGPRQLRAVFALQLAAGGALAVQLLVGREVLQGLMAIDGEGAIGSIVPALGILIGATILIGFIGALVAHQRRLLTELVAIHTFDQIIDVATIPSFTTSSHERGRRGCRSRSKWSTGSRP